MVIFSFFFEKSMLKIRNAEGEFLYSIKFCCFLLYVHLRCIKYKCHAFIVTLLIRAFTRRFLIPWGKISNFCFPFPPYNVGEKKKTDHWCFLFVDVLMAWIIKSKHSKTSSLCQIFDMDSNIVWGEGGTKCRFLEVKLNIFFKTLHFYVFRKRAIIFVLPR